VPKASAICNDAWVSPIAFDKQNGQAIRYIENPSEKIKELAA
jgi:hypothetical protein